MINRKTVADIIWAHIDEADEQDCLFAADDLIRKVIAPIVAERDEARAALKPFAATGALLESKPKDDACWAGQQPAPPITYGQLRAAAAIVGVQLGTDVVVFSEAPDEPVVLMGRSLSDIDRDSIV